ncbi:lysogeny pheromone AimP family peptide [Bacillus vallismortis]|nr:lysogeny pheromone AimP family peptide [Bacillus vallismortis]MCY7916169.1 lysogeny pheromone AimP family peptide [Bacillus vallismortis]
MKKVFIGLTIVAALAIGFVAGQHNQTNNASGNVSVASASRGA